MPLRHNAETGGFEGSGDDTIRVSPNMRYNNATGEFEPIGGPAPRRRGRRALDAEYASILRAAAAAQSREEASRRAEISSILRAAAVPRSREAASRREEAAARRREARRRAVFARLLGLMFCVNVLVLLFGGGGNVLLAVCAIFFFLWFCYRLVTGALWPWLVLGGLGLASCLK